MKRYIKQYNEYSCGPVAILNALKWAGANVTHRADYKRIAELCKCDKDGTYDSSLDRALRVAGKNLLQVRWPLWIRTDEVRRHLRDGGACITTYWVSKYKAGHFSFWFMENGRIYEVNSGDSQTISPVTERYFKSKLKSHHIGDDVGYPEVWLITLQE